MNTNWMREGSKYIHDEDLLHGYKKAQTEVWAENGGE